MLEEEEEEEEEKLIHTSLINPPIIGRLHCVNYCAYNGTRRISSVWKNVYMQGENKGPGLISLVLFLWNCNISLEAWERSPAALTVAATQDINEEAAKMSPQRVWNTAHWPVLFHGYIVKSPSLMISHYSRARIVSNKEGEEEAVKDSQLVVRFLQFLWMSQGWHKVHICCQRRPCCLTGEKNYLFFTTSKKW